MKATPKKYSIGEICEGFEYKENEGWEERGLGGKLVIQPEYQRNYLYASDSGKKEKAVIQTLFENCPLGQFYFAKRNGQFEILDGQQRITSIGRFMTNKFSINENGLPLYFSRLENNKAKKDWFINKTIDVVICEGTEEEIRKWFERVNTGGIQVNQQEMLNAVFSGSFVTAGKRWFSNGEIVQQNSAWTNYLTADYKRQGLWEIALDWVSEGNIKDYMAAHQNDGDIKGVKEHFDTVIKWVDDTFINTRKEMKGLDWGGFYRKYVMNENRFYNPKEVKKIVDKLYADEDIVHKSKIYEYVLDGCEHTNLLDFREFETDIKKEVYNAQTNNAEKRGISNCPYCAKEGLSFKDGHYDIHEMEADHITPWKEGGRTVKENCQLLCRKHNRQKSCK
jgi:5-methylcytosine-specific restriction endonuclease McrA